MPILIIHGDNTIASREFFLSHKKSLTPAILELDGQDLTFSRLSQASSTPNLLGELPVIIIENFFSRRPSNEKKKIIEFLPQASSHIITYDSRDISSQLKTFEPKYIKSFPLPKYLYSFLESFSLTELKLTLKSDPPELVVGALAKHLHNLLLVKSNSANLPSWQINRLKAQAAKYSQEKLFQMTQFLLDLDFRQKTGNSPVDYASALELWCLKV